MSLAKTAFVALVLAYPLIVYFGLKYAEVRVVALALIFFALTRLFLIRRMDDYAGRLPQSNLVVAGLILVGIAAMASNSAVLLQYYPVCMNALMLSLFAFSLIHPPSIVEQIARVTTPDLPEAGIVYTRKVTIVWCGFFIFNGSMSLYTVLGTDLGFWAVYNSLISYSLMGLLFTGEYLVRRTVQRKATRHRDVRGWC